MSQTETLSYDTKADIRKQELRNSLWDIASNIFRLNPDELEIFEKEIRRGPDTPINDVTIIRVSQIVRKYHKELVELEEKSRMARINAMHPVTVKRDMTPEALTGNQQPQITNN